MAKLRGAVAHDLAQSDRTADVLLPDDITFSDMFLSSQILNGLQAAGFRRPSPIQRRAIPIGRCGADLIVQSKSGTGKTLVFAIIALEKIDISLKRVQVLIVTPTREIAVQIKEVLITIATGFPTLKICCFIGGLDLKVDTKSAKTCQIAVGTPGRLVQLVKAGHLNLQATRLLVLDEADRLVTDSFLNSINFLFRKLPERKQSLVVSATFPSALESLISRYLVDPRHVHPYTDTLLLGQRQYVIVTCSHTSPLVRLRNKTEKLLNILSSLSFRQCIIFFNLQSRMEGLCRDLAKKGWPTLTLGSVMPQQERLNTVAALQTQRCRILLTTDLAARGIDAEQVDLVINMDLPYDTETYLHRIGRAGRFGAPGVAVSIVEDGKELNFLRNIFCDIKGADFKVPLLPDEITPDVWQKETELKFIEALEREVSGVDVHSVSTDEATASMTIGKDKRTIERNKTAAIGENLTNGLEEENETAEECFVDTKVKKSSMAKGLKEFLQAQEIVRSYLPQIPKDFPSIPYKKLIEMYRYKETELGYVALPSSQVSKEVITDAIECLLTFQAQTEQGTHDTANNIGLSNIKDNKNSESVISLNKDNVQSEDSNEKVEDVGEASDSIESNFPSDEGLDECSESAESNFYYSEEDEGEENSSDESSLGSEEEEEDVLYDVTDGTLDESYFDDVISDTSRENYDPFDGCECPVCLEWFQAFLGHLSRRRRALQRSLYAQELLDWKMYENS